MFFNFYLFVMKKFIFLLVLFGLSGCSFWGGEIGGDLQGDVAVDYVDGVPVAQDLVLEVEPRSVPEGVKFFELIARNWEFVPNIIKVNLGDRVWVDVRAVDVEHGFFIPEYGINRQIRKNETVHVEFVADKKGEFEFKCSMYCGEGHYGMKGRLVVE